MTARGVICVDPRWDEMTNRERRTITLKLTASEVEALLIETGWVEGAIPPNCYVSPHLGRLVAIRRQLRKATAAPPDRTFDDARPNAPVGYAWPLWSARKEDVLRPCEWCGRLTVWTVRWGVACCSYQHTLEDGR